ncbi:protein GET4 isoform X4 [Cryptomeria japonica]|uniref:protein GET4 isoform X4 n=1 Tax=Cryptomeria japonica TaxID=3369 RepID=UPI0027DA48FB|nr:protein GET4 isoform X4 [Cryptomeria japonica]
MHKMGSVKKFSSETNMHKVECERKSQRYDGEKNQLHRIRYMTAQKYEEALNLMQSGASIQLRHGQVTCGAELALLFVETLIKAKIPYTREALDRIGTIFSEFPQLAVPHKLLEEDDLRKLSEILVAAKARVDGCSSFLKAAIKWSAAYGGPSKGAAELHDMLAQYISSQSPELDFAKASKYFVNGSHPKAFAVALVDFSEKSYIGEADLAIARGILMYLVSGDLRDANCLMDELREQSTLKEIVLPSTPLLQFLGKGCIATFSVVATKLQVKH